ncbi:hypothetical protein [Delftia sp. RIT313]|uniref:hypothetical protein n=1 Tax=Delftia sp. RIT313 TaxID=1468410 RepID=UPI00044C210F|nr:hypothetical protein [Delftia sp. RIT313]EZP50529.1 hypothetical protein BW39_04203 [Delftia sp. RIT313]
MATQKNAARVAVKAKPCQKKSDMQPRDALDCIALGLPLSAVAQPMPTLQQTMLLVTSYVEWSLEEVIKERCKDVGWDDKDVDVDFAVDLALTHVRLLRAEIPLDRSTFESKWFMAGAAVNLAAKTFSRPDSLYYRRLIAARRQFEVLFELLDFFGAEVGHAD